MDKIHAQLVKLVGEETPSMEQLEALKWAFSIDSELKISFEKEVFKFKEELEEDYRLDQLKES